MSKEESKARHLKPYDFKTGGVDNDGDRVEKIYAKSPEFVVYRTERSIRLDMDDDSENLTTYLHNHQKIGVDLARIYSWLPESLSWSEAINRQIARAMTTNVSGNYDDAKLMLAHAEDRIVKLKVIQGRLLYTLSAFFLVFIAFVFAILLPFSGYEVLSKVALCGSLGGVLSIATGFSTMEIDIDANVPTNCLIGGSRIIIAIAAALFSYFAIQSDVAFSFVKNISTNHGIYMIAMVAGFAEMLVPNIMNNLVKESGEHNPET